VFGCLISLLLLLLLLLLCMRAGLLNGDEASLKAAKEFFASEFPKDTPLALISSNRDSIARPEDLQRLFVVATDAREVRWPHVQQQDTMCQAGLVVSKKQMQNLVPQNNITKSINMLLLRVSMVCLSSLPVLQHPACQPEACMQMLGTSVLTLHLLLLQGEDVALFSIDGNHFGYENELDLPNRINFDGAKVKLGPISFGLDWADKPFKGLVNAVNKVIVPGFEWLQYKAYFLSPILVSVMTTLGCCKYFCYSLACSMNRVHVTTRRTKHFY
jgi:hypothetical protein